LSLRIDAFQTAGLEPAVLCLGGAARLVQLAREARDLDQSRVSGQAAV